ncbi:MAG: hypothetical protein Q9191_005729 [Dirinaria sp. TL-2023a]
MNDVSFAVNKDLLATVKKEQLGQRKVAPVAAISMEGRGGEKDVDGDKDNQRKIALVAAKGMKNRDDEDDDD